MSVLFGRQKVHICTRMHKAWFWQFPVNFPFNRFIIEDVLKRNITYVVSACHFAIFICFALCSSDDKDPCVLKNQTKVTNTSPELFSFLPSLRLKVKYETGMKSE